MRGWTSFVVGFLILGIAYWSFTVDGLGTSTLMFAALALFFFVCGAAGREVSDAGGPTAVIDFVTNPADAIVDSATDKLADWLGDDTSKEQQAQQAQKADVPVQKYKFEHGDALARYWEQRDAESAGTAAAPPQRGFGRKRA
jgi:hypothetical protein